MKNNNVKDEIQRLVKINEILRKEINILATLLDESNQENERIQRYLKDLDFYMKIHDIRDIYGAY